MRAAFSALVAAALCTLALAAPTPAPGTGISIPLTKRGGFKKTLTKADVRADRARAYGKINALKELQAAKKAGVSLSKRVDEVKLTDEQDNSYWAGDITLSGKTFKVDFDSGSADLIFFPGGSDTVLTDAEDTGQTYSISYGDGSSSSGDVYSATLKIAGLTLDDQLFGFPSDNSGSSSDDGPPLLGLGQSALSVTGATPVVSALFSQGSISQNTFGVALTETGAVLDIGTPNSKIYTGSFTSSDVSGDDGFWRIKFTGISVGGSETVKSITGIVDTGTTLLYVGTTSFKDIANAVGGEVDESEGVINISCDADVPDISIKVDGASFTLSSNSLIFDNGDDSCILGIADGGASESGDLENIFGDVFLSNVYALFNYEESTVGFAQLA